MLFKDAVNELIIALESLVDGSIHFAPLIAVLFRHELPVFHPGTDLVLGEHPEHLIGVHETQGIVLTRIGQMTVPAIGIQAIGDPGTEGVQMDILDEPKEISFPVAQDRLVSPLEEVANGMVSPIKVCCIRLIHTLHELGQRDVSCLDEQMEVIVHQDVRIDTSTRSVLVNSEVEEELLKISGVFENTLLLIAPDDNVVEGAGEFYAGFARHETSIADRTGNVNISSFQA
jgi:hypothetical protein